MPIVEVNDTIFDANPVDQLPFVATGTIGDNPNIVPEDDVDMISFHLDAGERVTINIDAAQLGSDDRRQLVDGDGLVRRAFVGRVPVAGPRIAAQRSLHGFLLTGRHIGMPGAGRQPANIVLSCHSEGEVMAATKKQSWARDAGT